MAILLDSTDISGTLYQSAIIYFIIHQNQSSQ